jgi:hypothetical protein
MSLGVKVDCLCRGAVPVLVCILFLGAVLSACSGASKDQQEDSSSEVAALLANAYMQNLPIHPASNDQYSEMYRRTYEDFLRLVRTPAKALESAPNDSQSNASETRALETNASTSEATTTQGSQGKVSLDAFATQLGLSESQATMVKDIINKLKDTFTAICCQKATHDAPSPTEHLAALMKLAPQSGNAALANFVAYMGRRKLASEDKTYAEKIAEEEKAALEQVTALLNPDQARALAGVKVGSLLDVETGYDPFAAKLKELISQ